jgi:hypothetical protein
MITGIAGTELAMVVAAGQYLAIDPAFWHGANSIKVRSGTSGSPVAQGADRTLTLVVRSWNAQAAASAHRTSAHAKLLVSLGLA